MKNKILLIYILLLLFSFGNSFSQNKEIDSLQRVLQVSKIDTAKVNLYNAIADQFKNTNPDSTAFYANKASLLSQKINYNFGFANSYINKGNYNIILGNYSIAKQDFSKSKQLLEKLINSDSEINSKLLKNGLARIFGSYGIIHSQQSNYYGALESYQKALKIYQEIGAKKNIAKVLNNIGVVYKSQQNYNKAIEYFNKAFIIQQEIGEQSAAVTLTNIGIIYFEQSKNKQALSSFSKAQNLFLKIDDKRGFALLNNYLGDYYRNEKNYDLALSSYNLSLKLYEEIQNKFGASLVLYNLGQFYTDQKKYSQAMPFVLKSLEYSKQIGVLDQTYHSEKLLSELYGFLNNPEQSFLHYKQYIVAKDSITDQSNSKKIIEAEMNFEFKKKEALLIEKNKRQTQLVLFSVLGGLLLFGLLFVLYNRRQIKRRLTLQKEVAEYEQKALHLQMNPHFVFNCLGSISSFIVQNGTDSALKYLSKFSKLMRLTLEYSKGALIPIDKEIESLQNYLELEQLRFHKKFEFKITSSDKVEFNMAMPPLLIQPFVENAILHGIVPKDGNGKIEVNFDVQNSHLICTITDDGIGVSRSKLLKENSVIAHQSMALEITKKRLEMMETATSKSAQIDIKDVENYNEILGTCVTLRLPIQYMQ